MIREVDPMTAQNRKRSLSHEERLEKLNSKKEPE